MTLEPLFHINFLPDLMQVNIYPFTVDVEFNLAQTLPDLIAAPLALLIKELTIKAVATITAIGLRIVKFN